VAHAAQFVMAGPRLYAELFAVTTLVFFRVTAMGQALQPSQRKQLQAKGGLRDVQTVPHQVSQVNSRTDTADARVLQRKEGQNFNSERPLNPGLSAEPKVRAR
jgi:hypothetical protein